MKKIFMTFLAVGLLASAPSQAKEMGKFKREYGMAGCGLGAMVIGKEGGQIFAATTNGTLYNQLFGITFGTLGCIDPGMGDTAARMDKYIDANKLALANDIARGNGEALNALASMLGCTDMGGFGSAMQSNYQNIYTDLKANPMEITDNMITVIMNNPSLASSCRPIVIG